MKEAAARTAAFFLRGPRTTARMAGMIVVPLPETAA